MRLAEMEPTAGWPHGSSGNKKWINGVIFLVNASITPARSPIFKIPVQKEHDPKHGDAQADGLSGRLESSFSYCLDVSIKTPIYDSGDHHERPESI